MKKSEFKSLIKEVVSEMSFETDPDIELYRYIQMRLRRDFKPENVRILKQVAGMIEKEKGHLLNKEVPITHKVD